MLKKNHGFTLIEIIITLAILGIAAAMAFSLFNTGNNIFTNGGERFNVQSEVRLASDFITDELRDAKTLTLVSALPNPLDSNSKYLYVSNDGVLIQIVNGSSSNHSAAILIADTEMFSIITHADNKYTVDFILSGTTKHESYEVTTSAYLNNIKGKLSTTTGQIIVYTSPT